MVVSLRKTLDANFLTGSLCGVEDKHRCLFHSGIYWRKNKKKTNKNQVDMVLPVSPKEGLNCNCPMINVYDAVPQVRRMNRSN